MLLARLKAIYFAVGALHYVFYVYRMKFYTQYLGLQEDQAGLVQAAWNFSSFLGVALWSNLADTFGIHRALLIGICLGLGAVFELTLLRPVLVDGWAVLVLAMVVFSVYGLLMGGLLPLTDDQILKLLAERYGAERNLYGRQAMFGMLACGLVTCLLGELLDGLGVAILLWAVPASALLSAAAVWLFGHVPLPRDRHAVVASEANGDEGEDEGKRGKPMTGTMVKEQHGVSFAVYLRTLIRPRFVFLLLTILASGFGRQMLALFLPHYLHKDLRLSERAIGRAYLGSSLLSIVFFFVSPYALSRLGIRPMLLIGQGALLARLCAYAFCSPGAQMVPVIELLNGLSYSFTHTAAVREANECAPPGWEAAFQAAYGCAHVQFPAVVVSLVGGHLYRAHGGRALLTYALLTPAISAAVLTLVLFHKLFRAITRR